MNWSAGYEASGLRAWKQSGSGRTYFLYDGADPVCELDSSGNVLATNTFGAGLLSRHTGPVTGGSSVFYTFDERGNTAQRLDASGNPLSTDLYDAYGKKATAPNDPFGYHGQDGYYTDPETGLLYLQNRYYDPGTGRFVTRDPAGYGGGINLYSYARNNPVMGSDPSGLAPNGDGNGDDDLDNRLGGGGSEGNIIGAGLTQFGQQAQFQPGSQARRDTSNALRQIPGVGIILMGIGAATGCDYIAGTHESPADRAWDGAGAVLGALPYAGMVKQLKLFEFAKQLELPLFSKIPTHHIATVENEIGGKQWTNVFRPMFDKFDVDMQDIANKVDLIGHTGPHPDEYHEWVLEHLEQANTRDEFLGQLRKLKNWLSQNPEKLNGKVYPNLP